jgi:hypothetical protein
MVSWGDRVVERCDAVVFLTLDPTERMRRIEAREHVRRQGGPVDHEALADCLTWARGYDDPLFQGRSRARHEEWLATLACPILRLDGPLRVTCYATRSSPGIQGLSALPCRREVERLTYSPEGSADANTSWTRSRSSSTT